MNYQNLKKISAVSILILMLSATNSNAKVDDRTTEITREAVDSASPHDWYTLAISAEKCFKKKGQFAQID